MSVEKGGRSLDSFVDTICGGYLEKNKFDPELYEKFQVHRGLRNPDGSGVLAGVTRIGSVQGAVLRDGERIPIEGRLYYRGIEINDLIGGFEREGRLGFEEIAYLLLTGELPKASQLEEFKGVLSELYALPDGFTENMILKAPSRDIMNKLARSLLALYSYDAEPDGCSARNLMRQSIELIARIPLIVSHAYAVKSHYFDNRSLVLHRPQEHLSIAENLLHTLRHDSSYTDEEARILDMCLVLHAEHGGGNNSAFSARVLSSSGTDTYSAMSAAVGSLKGPRHGGANLKVMGMLDEIMANVRDWNDRDEISAYLGRMLDKRAGDGSGLIYGMGHAVYTLSDPRAVILSAKAAKMAEGRGMSGEYGLIKNVAELAPGEFYKRHGTAKVIGANVDLFSGFIYKMCDIPSELFTPVFAVARMVGWCAHRIEERLFGGRIIRPAYRSISPERKYVLLSDRD